jgi:hypothetical protein
MNSNGQADNRRPQPVIRAAVEATFRRLLEDSTHLTLTECRDRLAAETGVRVHPWTVGRTLAAGLDVTATHHLWSLPTADSLGEATEPPATPGKGPFEPDLLSQIRRQSNAVTKDRYNYLNDCRTSGQWTRLPYSSTNGFFVPRNCSRIGVPGSLNVSRRLLTRYRV